MVTVATFVGDLIDPDPPQTLKTIYSRLNIIVDPGDDCSDGPPRHPQQLTGCAFRGSHRKPGRHRVEVAGVAGVVSGPWNLSDRWAMG